MIERVFIDAGEDVVIVDFLSVSVCLGDDGEQAVSATLPHLCHGTVGVSLLCRSCVWMGFSRFCPQGGRLFHLSVC